MKASQYLLWLFPLIAPCIARSDWNNQCCLTDEEANYIANTWLPLNVQPPSAWLNNPYYNQTAYKLLAPNFQLYSDSDNYVGSPPPSNPVRSAPHIRMLYEDKTHSMLKYRFVISLREQ